ncbi:P-loop NTPase fold protein [Myxococcus faecalis]|uniref:P-loop NTPase fold protein n=1 Tax=Myxococcus faecalis TaxID=3115646 RepID=UPI003CECF984
MNTPHLGLNKTPPPSNGIKQHQIRQRWFEIAALSLPAAGITHLILQHTPLCKTFTEHTHWIWIPSFAVLYGASHIWGRNRLSAWSGLRHFWRYPPPWAAAILGFLWLTLYLANLPRTADTLACPGLKSDELSATLSSTWPLIFIGACCFGIILITATCIADCVHCPQEPETHKKTSQEKTLTPLSLTENFDELRAWIQHDTPIQHPHLDAFNRRPTALRIVERIRGTTTPPPTIALIGELGSGKTSILHLITHELKNSGPINQNIIVTQISLWPFETIDAAIRATLSAITREISHHINTIPMSGLSDEYINTIEKANAGWISFFRNHRSPLAIISDFDKVATALELRIVLWIEDLERFAGPPTASTIESERLGPIRSLLHMFSDTKCIQLILASTHLGTKFDIEKIARFIEPLPTIDHRTTWPIIKAFIDACWLPRDFIDPAITSVRQELHGKKATHTPSQSALLLPYEMNLPIALATICSNPRKLKFGLRHCLDAWETLRGEIDFDDLLVVSLLRAAEPELFAIITDSIDELRSEIRRTHSTSTAPESNFAKAFSTLTATTSSPRKLALERALDFVFPNWQEPGKTTPRKTKPQGISTKHHRNYWERYLTLTIPPKDQRDQPVLGAVVDWKEGRNKQLIELLTKGTQVDPIESFIETMLAPNDLLRLLKELVLAEVERTPADWMANEPAGLVAIWRTLLDHPNEQLPQVIEEILIAITPRNVQLAYDIIYLFLTRDSSNVPELLPREAADKLKSKFQSLLKESFTDSPTKLAAALRDANPYVLLWSAWGLRNVRERAFVGLPFPDWSLFSKTLLDAAEASPTVVFPQIVPFLVDSENQIKQIQGQYHETIKFTTNKERASRLFDIKRLFDIVRTTGPLNLPEESQLAYNSVLGEAHHG